jgi:hypothetical protein
MVDGIARQIFFSYAERPPTRLEHNMTDMLQMDQDWRELVEKQPSRHVEVFVDGSMRYPVTALDVAFPQPKTLQTASYAQGGILFRFDTTHPIASRLHDVTMVTDQGPALHLSLPSSIELYTILLALHCMEVSSLVGTVYTDYIKAVKVANNPKLLTKMGREDNLPLYEYLLTLMARNPGIALQHVKAHGDYKKNKKWSRPQWGNYYADLLAKNDTSVFSDVHRTIPIGEIEKLVRRHSR